MTGPQYGFWLGEIVVKPYLSREEMLEDTQSGELPFFRRPGAHNTYHIIFRDDIEPYYRRKGIPEPVILQKLKDLKVLSEKEKRDIVTRKLAIAPDSQLSLLKGVGT